MKRILFFFSLFFLPCALHAEGIVIDSFTATPNEIFANKTVTVVISAHISNLKSPLPTKVILKRLQADGNFTDVGELHDDGSHGDLVKNDRTYTTTSKLKEPVAGMLAYVVEVHFPNGISPMRSKPVFVKVMGKPWGS